MALIFWENTLITRDEKPVVALLLGTENGMYETNDSYCQAIEEVEGLLGNIADAWKQISPKASSQESR